MLRRQQPDIMALAGKAPRPGMGRAAGFHHDAQRCAVLQALRKRPAPEPIARDDATGSIGKGQLEHVLGQVDSQHDGGRFNSGGIGGSVHGGLLP